MDSPKPSSGRHQDFVFIVWGAFFFVAGATLLVLVVPQAQTGVGPAGDLHFGVFFSFVFVFKCFIVCHRAMPGVMRCFFVFAHKEKLAELELIPFGKREDTMENNETDLTNLEFIRDWTDRKDTPSQKSNK